MSGMIVPGWLLTINTYIPTFLVLNLILDTGSSKFGVSCGIVLLSVLQVVFNEGLHSSKKKEILVRFSTKDL